MAKFCGKCGTKIDQSTGLCPKCDAEKLKKADDYNHSFKSNEEGDYSSISGLSKKEMRKFKKKEKRALKKAAKKAKRENWSLGKKIRRFFLKIFIIVMLIVTIGVAFKLMSFNQMDTLFISDKLDELRNDSQDINRSIPDTDTDGFTYFRSSSENLAHDLDEGITFINNEILITLKSEDDRKALEDYLLSKGGKIVGGIPELSEYQIVLDTEYTYLELIELSSTIQSFEWVSDASPNYAVKMDMAYYPDDSKWKNKWENIPSGNNWGMEAIDAPGAWEYKDKLQSVNIGILDDMFDVNHKDLFFAEEPLGNYLTMFDINDGDLKWSSHGTHTAGTIAAIFDNKTGVTGVSIKTNLYGVSARGMAIAGYYSSQAWKIALYYLIAEKKCSVINISMAFDQLTFEASRGESIAIEVLKIMSSDIQKTLRSLIEHEYPFVICKAAGNQNEVNGDDKYKYFRKDEGDNNTEWSYYSYTEYKKYLAGDTTNEKQFARYKNRKKEIEGRLESGNVDAKYDILGAIEDEEVKKRIIMVGAAENLGTHNEGGFFGIGGQKVHDGYQIAAFSQCGKRVDVIAPGVDIYSTVKNGYSNKEGTSMAAPHVAGIAGLAFSANSDIKGDVVKKIICDTAVGEYGDDKYGLVNAKNVVEAALNYEEEEKIEQSDEADMMEIHPEAIKFNNHYYYLYPNGIASSYNEALEYCKSKGGYLATLTSEEENDFVYSYIKQQKFDNAYFGLSDSGKEGVWEWCTGEPVSYINWHSGEPNGENSNEDYAMFYYKYNDGAWNDGDFGGNTLNGGTSFICEWGDYSLEQLQTPTDRTVVLTLDVSGSMSGTPLDETKKASSNFIDTVLDQDANIGIVTYKEESNIQSGFSNDRKNLQSIVSSLYSGGGTNIEAGLKDAQWMLEKTNAKKKIIVLMSDGEPNNGLEGEELIQYANEIKESGTIIYTLGFFESLDNKSYAQYLMENIASDGCHYEVANADELVFFFEDMADQINGQKYIYVRIACPVDVSVTYNGETLDSSESNSKTRTSFGTLTFEENHEEMNENMDDKIKVLRLKEGVDYDLELTGTGHGVMNYTIGFMDDNGDYSDLRKFENIKITRKTKVDTVATYSDDSVLNIDDDGDGKYDLKLRAEANGYGEEVKTSYWIIYVIIGAVVLLFVDIIAITVYVKSKRRRKGE